MNEYLIKALLKPEAYPEPTSSVHLIQTHVSFIFVTDNYVYKIKKPVDFGFLNFTTLDRRRFYCNEEVRLNRRLCRDIYLGVVDVKESPGGASFVGGGKTVDYAVKMKRLPEECMLDRRVAEEKVNADDMRRIARTIAAFHQEADSGGEIDRFGGIEIIKKNWDENFQQLIGFIGITLKADDLNSISDWVSCFISSRESLFSERVSKGFIRDCDGDIHMENICLNREVCIFDCIEFNSRFRYSDTAADIAFLLMDLDFCGKSDLGKIFTEEYIRVTGDTGIVDLLPFYKVYRAVVRGKVESLKLNDPAIPEAEKESAREKAVRYLRLARSYIIRTGLRRSLFIMCGLMGSGKTAVASVLSKELGVAVASSDRVRKSDLPEHSHAFVEYGSGMYAPAIMDITYRKLADIGEDALRSGKSIIIDATFSKKKYRLLFRSLAERNNAEFFILQTACPRSLIRKRLDERQKNPDEISDGRWELFQRHESDFEPLNADEGKCIFIDTSLPINDNMNLIIKSIGIPE